METHQEESPLSPHRKMGKESLKELATFSNLTPKELAQKIKNVENEMYQHARNLEFEQAAKLRDELHKLNELMKTIS